MKLFAILSLCLVAFVASLPDSVVVPEDEALYVQRPPVQQRRPAPQTEYATNENRMKIIQQNRARLLRAQAQRTQMKARLVQQNRARLLRAQAQRRQLKAARQPVPPSKARRAVLVGVRAGQQLTCSTPLVCKRRMMALNHDITKLRVNVLPQKTKTERETHRVLNQVKDKYNGERQKVTKAFDAQESKLKNDYDRATKSVEKKYKTDTEKIVRNFKTDKEAAVKEHEEKLKKLNAQHEQKMQTLNETQTNQMATTEQKKKQALGRLTNTLKANQKKLNSAEQDSITEVNKSEKAHEAKQQEAYDVAHRALQQCQAQIQTDQSKLRHHVMSLAKLEQKDAKELSTILEKPEYCKDTYTTPFLQGKQAPYGLTPGSPEDSINGEGTVQTFQTVDSLFTCAVKCAMNKQMSNGKTCTAYWLNKVAQKCYTTTSAVTKSDFKLGTNDKYKGYEGGLRCEFPDNFDSLSLS